MLNRTGDNMPASSPELSSHLLGWQPEHGLCRVMCFSPVHGASLSSMSLDQVRTVVDTWSDQHTELASLPFVSHVQIFENRGAMMGASNPHPHGQSGPRAPYPTFRPRVRTPRCIRGGPRHMSAL